MDKNLAKKVGAKAVTEAGKLVMTKFARINKMTFKRKNDIVTEMDYESEKLIIDIIRKHFPDHNFYTEESGTIDEQSDYTWLVDPIDGSINYFHAMAPFRIAVCLLHKEEPIMTFIYNPLRKQLHFAEKGKGAFLDGKRIKVSDNNDLKHTIVHTHISSRIDARARTLLGLGSIFREILHVRVIGSGIAATTYIADGKFDVFFNISTNPWDVLPGALLVEEAGGKVTDVNGKKVTIDSTSILATNGKIHRKMLRMLKNV